MSKLLDYGREYFFVFPAGLGGHDEPWISISEDCPPDIRERLEKDWEIAKRATEERHRNGIWNSSKDYF